MLVFVTFVLWSALLYGLTGGAKRLGRLIGIDESPPFVRALPLMPFVFGGVTGMWVLPAFAAELGLEIVASLPIAIFPFLGFGAGGVAASSFKVLNQTILGKDDRLQTSSRPHGRKVELNAQKFRDYQQSQTGRRKR